MRQEGVELLSAKEAFYDWLRDLLRLFDSVRNIRSSTTRQDSPCSLAGRLFVRTSTPCRPSSSVQHTPSIAVQEMLEATLRGAKNPELGSLDVEIRAALSSGPADVLAADAVILGTPANIGYMSGALKHFLDQVYYPCMEVTHGVALRGLRSR